MPNCPQCKNDYPIEEIVDEGFCSINCKNTWDKECEEFFNEFIADAFDEHGNLKLDDHNMDIDDRLKELL